MAEVTARSLGRLRRALQRRLRRGWQRAIFATPIRDGQRDERVVDGPGMGSSDQDALETLVNAAIDAAREGFVKQTFVLNAQTKIEIDARHGAARVRQLDATKVMGGKERPLRPDHSAPLLRAIGIMNVDGTISSKNAKKYKQANHMVELCRPVWERLVGERDVTGDSPIRVLDLACGNSVLTFVLAEALRLAGIPARLHGIDLRDDVIMRSRDRARQLDASNMTFSEHTIADAMEDPGALVGGPIDLVVSLHACDTATDEALALSIRAGVPAIFAAPCCQHELASQLETERPVVVSALARHGLLRHDYAALLTDALRVEILEACGYRVDLLEFVESTHTPKNLLIRARRRVSGGAGAPTAAQLAGPREICDQLGVDPSLLRLVSSSDAATVD